MLKRLFGRPVWLILSFTLFSFLLITCSRNDHFKRNFGITWAVGSFKSNGERIYYTATSDRGTDINYTGGPSAGMMMMGGRLACVSCHGTDARGGKHVMEMDVMDAPDIRWSVLEGEHEDHHEEAVEGEHEHHHEGFDFQDFKNAVERGRHPDGETLSSDMPRWKMSDGDLKDLMNYLKSLDK